MACSLHIFPPTGTHNGSHSSMNPIVFFTDLDQCVLDGTDYSMDEVKSALDALKSVHIPVVFVSGKTRAEIEPLRQRLHHEDPFIAENGAAAFVPRNTFDFPLQRSRRRSAYEVVELGTPYAMLRDVLKQIEEAVNTPLRGFGDLSLDEIMRATGLSREEALRARRREYNEPFLMNAPASLRDEVFRQIAARGLRCVESGGFFHLTGANDAARAAEILRTAYHRKWTNGGEPFAPAVVDETAGGFFQRSNADRPVPAQKPDDSSSGEPTDKPGMIKAPGIGSAEWRQAVRELLKPAA